MTLPKIAAQPFGVPSGGSQAQAPTGTGQVFTKQASVHTAPVVSIVNSDSAYQRRLMAVMKSIQPLISGIIRKPGTQASDSEKIEAIKAMLESVHLAVDALHPEGDEWQAWERGQLAIIAAQWVSESWVSHETADISELVHQVSKAVASKDVIGSLDWLEEAKWPEVASKADAASRLRLSMMSAASQVQAMVRHPVFDTQPDLLQTTMRKIFEIAASNTRYLDVSLNYRLMGLQGDINRVATVMADEFRHAGKTLLNGIRAIPANDTEGKTKYLAEQVPIITAAIFSNTAANFALMNNAVDAIINSEGESYIRTDSGSQN